MISLNNAIFVISQDEEIFQRQSCITIMDPNEMKISWLLTPTPTPKFVNQITIQILDL